MISTAYLGTTAAYKLLNSRIEKNCWKNKWPNLKNECSYIFSEHIHYPQSSISTLKAPLRVFLINK